MTKRPPRRPRPLRRLLRALPPPPRPLLPLLLLLPLLSLLYLSPPAPAPAAAPAPAPPPLSLPLPPTLHPPPAVLRTFIRLATGYLLRASYLGHHGPASFLYRPTLHPSSHLLSDTPDYNTLRHCGALYALAQVCPPPYHPAPPPLNPLCQQAPHVLRRGAAWLLNHTLAPVPRHPHLYGIWTHPEWRPAPVSNRNVQMKLGALGLGLVALVAAERAAPAANSTAVLPGLARSITELMRRRDGGFWSYYMRDTAAVDTRRDMRYYPGEAALGLIRLGAWTGQRYWVEEAAKGLRVMARAWGGEKCDHWGMIAVAELAGVGWRGEAWGELVRWARRVVAVCDGLNRERVEGGGVRAAGYATALEAVVAMAPVLAAEEGGGEAVGDMLCVVGRMLDKMALVQWRVAEGGREMLEGAMPGAAVVVRGRDGVVVERREGFQIDCTQHSLSAAVGFVKAVAELRFDSTQCAAGSGGVAPAP